MSIHAMQLLVMVGADARQFECAHSFLERNSSYAVRYVPADGVVATTVTSFT